MMRLNMRPVAVALDCPSRPTMSTPASFISSISDSKRATVRPIRFHLHTRVAFIFPDSYKSRSLSSLSVSCLRPLTLSDISSIIS